MASFAIILYVVSLHGYLLSYSHTFMLGNLLIWFISIFFFLNLCLGLLFFNTKSWIISLNSKNMATLYTYFSVLLVILLLFSKFYLSYIGEYHITLLADWNVNFIRTSLFSDTLLLLASIITVISWCYLSERFMFKYSFFILYFFIFVFCTANMVYTSNLMTMFIFFEFIFIPSLFFVFKFGYSKKVEKTVSFLLLWTLSGSFLTLMCFTYLLGVVKSLEIANLGAIKFSYVEQFFICFILFLGFGVKIPIWPFHYWLTKVHVEAPTGFSIFLSGFLVKTAFFCFSYTYIIFCNKFITTICLIFVIWGAIDSSLRMWTSADIKRLIAFATIQEMNLIMMFLLLNSNSSFSILNLFLLVHGLLSAFMFYLVDNVQKRFQTRNLTALSGLSLVAPHLHFFIWCGILIFRGFPLFIKLVIEWELLVSLLYSYGIFGFFIFFVISFFGVIGFCRIWLSVLYGQPSVLVAKGVDVLKKDLYIGYYLIGLLGFLNIFILLF